MSRKMRTLIEAVQELTPAEQLNLISVVTQSLCHSYGRMPQPPEFWEPQTAEGIAHAQQTQPVTSIEELAFGFWPDDESADDFIEYTYRQRHEDRLRDS